MMTIMYYICLSIYRIDRTNSNLALFSTFAAINALYCCKFNYQIILTAQLTQTSNMGSLYGLVSPPTTR